MGLKGDKSTVILYHCLIFSISFHPGNLFEKGKDTSCSLTWRLLTLTRIILINSTIFYPTLRGLIRFLLSCVVFSCSGSAGHSHSISKSIAVKLPLTLKSMKRSHNCVLSKTNEKKKNVCKFWGERPSGRNERCP